MLLAYSKLGLFDELVASDAPDDPWFERTLAGYFPRQLGRFAGAMQRHRLRREIVATAIAGKVVAARRDRPPPQRDRDASRRPEEALARWMKENGRSVSSATVAIERIGKILGAVDPSQAAGGGLGDPQIVTGPRRFDLQRGQRIGTG